jgi:hypothetical protein
MTFETLTESQLKLLLVIMGSGTTSPDRLPDLVVAHGHFSFGNQLRALTFDDIDRLWLRVFAILYPGTPTV